MSTNAFDQKVYDGISFGDICKEIHTNIQKKRKSLSKAAESIETEFIDGNVGTKVGLGQTYTGIIDSQIKNEEQLIKLAGIIQRVVAPKEADSSGGSLSQAEKDALLQTAKELRDGPVIKMLNG